ncbi:MAG: LamG domain-containing protein [Verrucomicrobiota bacterium]
MKTDIHHRTSLLAIPTLLAVMSLCTAPAQTNLTVDVGLVSYWPFDTTNIDGTTPDLASSANTMTNRNSPDLVSGVRSNCFSLNGSTHYVTRTHGFSPESDGLPIYWAPAGYTVAFWVKGSPQTAAGRGLFAMGYSASTNLNSTLRIATDKTANGNKLSLYVKDVASTMLINQINSASVVLDNTWHHIAWVDNKGAATLYVDGVPDTSNFNYTFPADPASMPLNITRLGCVVGNGGTGASLFNGFIDEVAIWERPLNQGEVQQVMTNGLPSPLPAAVPTVIQAPADAVRPVGGHATFSVAVVGQHPLSYQWWKDGGALTGQTNTTLVLTNLSSPGTSMISVVVSNSVGSITNSAQLTVVPVSGIAQGLVSYWSMDTVAGTPATTPDLYNGNDLALVNMSGTSLITGPFGQAFTFNGTSQYLNRAHGFSRENDGMPVYWAAGGYTVAFWVKAPPQTASGRFIFSMGNSTNAYATVSLTSDRNAAGDKLSVFIRTVTGTAPINLSNSASAVLDNTWHHIAWVDNKGTATLYVDGAVDSSLYNYTVPAPEMLPLNLTRVGASARSANITYFNGAVDEVAIWERALSQAEVQQVRTNGIPELVPAEPIRITSAELVAGKLRFTVQAQSPTQVISIEQKTELTGTWGGASGGGIVATNGLVWTAEFPANAPQRFYRAVGQ